MKTTIYANYGVLAHEKQTIYTTTPTDEAVYSEPITVDIPESFEPWKDRFDRVLVTINGKPCYLYEVLYHRNDKPCINWFDGAHLHYTALPIIKD